ncbi:Protein CBG11130 [Caenorhabditis briggsae]|uniref:Protein CBG11130 n=1 Tax=Caenorhabditis briggsae TaxID=6238 RepID=A8XCG9_CAEBR|nr:Protein CBG11130 [Caenorhabditis briggsae]CAP30336.2 Protein CBG11130 [Caenorhabditis briggsae]
MLFPTLFQLAAKSVAKQIHNEEIPLDFNLGSTASNEVVRQLLKLDPKNIEKLKTHKKQLSRLKELDLSQCKIDVEGILNLKDFKLNSLEFGDLYHLKAEFPHPTNPHQIDIVSLLERAVDTDSREMMVQFGFSGGYEEFESGWEEKISKLFPSLQSIKIIFSIFSNLSNLCNSFPNLRTLDISFVSDLSTLEGIKNLKHLQKLVMRNAELEEIHGYKELAELKNLRYLDVSGCDDDPEININVIGSLLAAEVRMQNLEFLDCSMTFFVDHELKEFVEHHPKLKTVVAICMFYFII